MTTKNNSKPSICYLGTKGIPARYGGAETGVQEISIRLIEKGYDIYVLGSSENKRITISSYKGVNKVDFPTMKHKSIDFVFRRFLSSLYASLSSQPKIMHFYGSDAGLYSIFPKIMGKKVIITLDGFEWERESFGTFEKLMLRFLIKLSLKIADHIIVDSRIMQKWIKKYYNISSSFVPYAANLDHQLNEETLAKYGLNKEDYLIFVGRLVEEKGVNVLINAFKQVKTNKKLVIVGDNKYNPGYEKKLEKMAEDDKRIIFLGSIYGNDYKDLLYGSYCYVSASKIEGTSPSLVQAMAFKLPVIVSNIPTNVEVLNDSGLSFRNGDEKDLASKIQYLIDNPSSAKELGQKGYERAIQYYSWESVVERLEKIYSKVYQEVKPLSHFFLTLKTLFNPLIKRLTKQTRK
ncbi:MAG: glycosyltransferase family 4 protein [Candidatus Heimdallarchaeaceae archaeon]